MVADADAVWDALSVAVTVTFVEIAEVPRFVPDTVHVVDPVVQPLTTVRLDPIDHEYEYGVVPPDAVAVN